MDEDATLPGEVAPSMGMAAAELDDTVGHATEHGKTHPGAPDTTVCEPGDTLGRYTVLGHLGSGGMGVVYAAYDPKLDRKIALKLLHGTADEAARERLMREAQALARISHPNVVAVFDVGILGDQIYLAMEYVRGQTLKQWLRASQRPREEILAMFTAAGEGLAAAHASGLVHRDFKPDNVIVDDKGRPRVVDFGLAREAGADESPSSTDASLERLRESHFSEELTRTGAIMGTPAYMPPEQHLGQPVDARGDQFSFCVSLFEAVYGERPFRGENVGQLAFKIMRGEVAQVDRSGVPVWVQQAIDRGLCVRPDDRFESMVELLRALAPATPSARDRRAGLWLGVAAVAVGGALWGAQAISPEPCLGSAEAVEQVWNPERAARIEAAFEGTQRGYAASSWARTHEIVSAYADAWVASRQDACEATQVRREQSERMMDLRTACLQGRLEHLDALLVLFEGIAPDELEHAVEAASALPDLAHCSDTEALAHAVDPPSGDQAPQVDEVRRGLAQVRALRLAGRYAQQLERSTELVAQAQAIGYLPLVAEAAAAHGVALVDAGRTEEAIDVLLDGAAAAEASGDDVLRQRILTDLVRYLGAEQMAFEEAMHLAELARATGERVGWDAARQGEYHDALGSVLERRGDFAGAVEQLRRALELREQALDEDDPLLATTLASLTAALNRNAENEEAAKTGRRAVELYEATLGPEHPLTASAYNNLGIVYVALYDHQAALECFEKSLEILRAALGPDHPEVALALNNVGAIHNVAGRHDQALGPLTQALKLRERVLGPDHLSVAESLNNIAGVHYARYETKQALELWRRALEIREAELGPEHPLVASTMGNAAAAEHDLREHEAALEHWRRVQAIYEKNNGPDHPDVSDALLGIGLALLELERAPEAVAVLARAHELREQHIKDPGLLGETRFAYARALWDSREDRTRARELATLAQQAFASTEDRYANALSEVDAWLAAR